MEIIRNLKTEDDIFNIGEVDSTLFNKTIPIEIDKEVSEEYAIKCVNHFNNLTEDIIKVIKSKANRFYLFMCEEWDEEFVEEINSNMPEYKNEDDILKYLTNPRMYIFLPNDERVGYCIECNCPWEPEHQCSIILLEDEVLYVGPSNGLDSWCDRSEYNTLYDN